MATLLGIARHARPRGPVEALDAVEVTIERGIAGDCRGVARPGSKRRRQVTIMAVEAWDAALDELGTRIDWSLRRVNLLSANVILPRAAGMRIHVGNAVLEVTGECDPCIRMNDIAPGLFAALTPDWRGGLLTRVITSGDIAVGDRIQIEDCA